MVALVVFLLPIALMRHLLLYVCSLATLSCTILIARVIPSFISYISIAVKSNLTAAAAFVILAILATFVSMLLFFPLWHWGFYIAGAVLAVLSGQI